MVAILCLLVRLAKFMVFTSISKEMSGRIRRFLCFRPSRSCRSYPDNSKEIHYEDQLTSGKASATNPSVDLANVTVSGQPKAQKLRTLTYIDETYLHPNPIVGSDQYMVNHKANHRKSLSQEENT